MQESHVYSYTTGAGGGWSADQGGRSLHLHLDMGDRLELYCQYCFAGLYRATFCVHLAQPDI